MIVVSDSSPLIVLAKLSMLDHLRSLFGTVLIPPEVREELGVKGEFQGVPDVLAEIADWVIVESASHFQDLPLLDSGEAAAISLAGPIYC